MVLPQKLLFLEIIQFATKHEIAHTFLVHFVLVKRLPVIESLSEGLMSLELLEMVKAFPKVFEPFFVHKGDVEAEAVNDLLSFQSLDDKRSSTASFLRKFIAEASNKGSGDEFVLLFLFSLLGAIQLIIMCIHKAISLFCLETGLKINLHLLGMII